MNKNAKMKFDEKSEQVQSSISVQLEKKWKKISFYKKLTWEKIEKKIEK